LSIASEAVFASNLVDAIMESAALPKEVKELLPSVWAKLVEAVFPDIDEAAFNLKVKAKIVIEQELNLFFLPTTEGEGMFPGRQLRCSTPGFDFTLDDFLRVQGSRQLQVLRPALDGRCGNATVAHPGACGRAHLQHQAGFSVE
jgi:hypothetical protein